MLITHFCDSFFLESVLNWWWKKTETAHAGKKSLEMNNFFMTLNARDKLKRFNWTRLLRLSFISIAIHLMYALFIALSLGICGGMAWHTFTLKFAHGIIHTMLEYARKFTLSFTPHHIASHHIASHWITSNAGCYTTTRLTNLQPIGMNIPNGNAIHKHVHLHTIHQVYCVYSKSTKDWDRMNHFK